MNWCMPRTEGPIEDMGWTREEIDNFYRNTSRKILEKAGYSFD